MSPVGVSVAASSVPPTTTSNYSTQNVFVVGRADWGPVGQAVRITNFANMASQIGSPNGSGNPVNSRTATCATSFDAIQTFFAEAGSSTPTVYFSRVAHGTPTSATIALAPSAALTLTAQYPGAGGNAISVAVSNQTTYVIITLTDASGNTLATSPQLTTLAACVAWCATTGYVTATSNASTLPSTVTATAMTGGADNFASATITDWQTALAVFQSTLGPGQVIAPGQVNSSLSGIWSALGLHAQANNRVAICNLDDNVSTSTAITNLSTFGTGATASYAGFWAGNRNIPGIASGTTRSVSPDCVIAGLCARADAAVGPNAAAAGPLFPTLYATTPTSFVSGAPNDTYSLADLQTLNAAGINTFQNINGLPMNYGFVSSELITTDAIFWEFNHARLRMALIANAQLVGQTYVFSQIDGQNTTATAFNAALTAMLLPYATSGQLWSQPNTAPASAFTVDTADVNTPATEAAGQLNATITCSFSYFAQNVAIQINVVPITQSVSLSQGS